MEDKMVEPGLEPITHDCQIDYEAEYKKLRAENEELKKNIDWLNHRHDEDYYEREQARLHGLIEGLKFAIRCNGVSGGEVK